MTHNRADSDDEPGELLPACQWGMSGWCTNGGHRRCYFTTDPDAVIAGYGLDCRDLIQLPASPCHENQGYPPCPHPDHAGETPAQLRADITAPVQINLF